MSSPNALNVELPIFDSSLCGCAGDALSGVIQCDYCMEEGPFRNETTTESHSG